jgi:hypothetical protein
MDRIVVSGVVVLCRCVWRPPEGVDALPRWLIVIKQDDKTSVRWLTTTPRYEVGERVEGTAAPVRVADPLTARADVEPGEIYYAHTRPNSYTVKNLRTKYHKLGALSPARHVTPCHAYLNPL